MGSQPVEFDEFAACLRALRERADLSYEALARRTGIGRSSLHRYCSGSHVPQDYGSAHRIATACGAAPEELRRLHRLWALADAARESDRDRGTDEGPGEDQGVEAGPAPEAASDTRPDSHPDTHPDSHPDSHPASHPDTDPTPAPTPHPPRRRRKPPTAAVLALVLALSATAWALVATSGSGDTAGHEDGLLFSEECAEPVSMGQQGACVREVQRLLGRAGSELDVDGEFGPETLRRVTAFQVLSRISVNGVVDDETKRALYAPTVRMDTWSAGKVRERVRKVFREVPDHAAAIADCQSSLDPLYIVPNPSGTRNWGVFQISDATLHKLGGTPRDALDPEWNIRAAHRLWSRAKSFADWPHCDGATSPEAVGPALVRAVGDRPGPPPHDASSPPPSPTGACPEPGQRFKTPTDDRVYLVGPGSSLYYIPDATVYFNLWNDWNGVAVVSGGVFADCGWDKARELANGFLARKSGSSQTYIWDAWFGYRAIGNRAVFDTYGFSAAKIRTRSSLSPVSDATRWQ
ncbi:helix-turn-helix domain-containing protein [Streptomyces ferrugineus]|uniref:Helix-turn-helix domain-containing protein n=1 Tax=Streptomyces ferrugineus TaxID=1413221 RepID=A0A7M2SNU0_9ACTN|nr:helix-turn-helix domain-containing protein [Streptomyces ferrugineus]QOV36921.1 helix-turn-helix domain-containing protein [Streptomyces ferrugineus]